MINISTEKRQHAAKLSAECKQLLKKAEDESRDMTAAEAAEFDSKMEEIQGIHQDLGGSFMSRREAMEATETLMKQPQDTIAGPQALNTELHFEDAGKNTRTLVPGESVRDIITARQDFDPELGQLGFGQVLRALATGARNEQERRALSMGIDTAGGYTVPSILASTIIDKMRARLVLGRAGVRYLPLLGGEMRFATVDTDPDPKWRGENQPVSEEEVVFGSLTLRPCVIAMVIKASRELLETSPNIESLLENTLARVMATKIDRAGLLGQGAGEGPIEPVGVANWPDIQTHAHNSTPNYDMVLEARKLMMMANSEEPTAAILSARDEGNISMLKDGQGLSLPKPPAIERLPLLSTTNIPTDLGAGTDSLALVGDFTKMIIAQKVSLQIQVLNERYADHLQVGFLVWAMLDFAIEQPEAFCKITGVGV